MLEMADNVTGTAGLQHPPHLGEEPFTQPVLLKQAPEFEQRCRIRHGFTAQINAHKATQAGAVIQSLFASEVGQIESVLHEVNPQHALQTSRRATVAAFRVIRFDYRAQFGSRNNHVHRVKKLVASCAFASGHKASQPTALPAISRTALAPSTRSSSGNDTPFFAAVNSASIDSAISGGVRLPM